jgi:mono/diheme cytochrome c family protein
MAVAQKRRLSLRRLALAVVTCGVLGAAGLWLLTLPQAVPAAALPARMSNLDNGKTMFAIGGCASCHAVPNNDPDKVDRLQLGGGLALTSPFGTFYVPNISPDPKDGIGAWSEADFVTALWKGTSERGENLFPAFPYTSYQHMQLDDVRDLFAYLKTLPAVAGTAPRHDLRFPFNQRELLGIWKLLFLHGGPFTPDPAKTAQWNRGAYLVNGPGHCAECHSPRNFLGGIVDSQRFAGGPSPDGNGWVPNITPLGLREDGKPWTEKEIASFPRRRHDAGRRFCRRGDDRCDQQYLAVVGRGPRRHGRLHRRAAACGRPAQTAGKAEKLGRRHISAVRPHHKPRRVIS